MKYALLIYTKPGAWEELSEAEQQASHAEYMAITEEPEVVGGEQLHPVESATTIRVNGGDMLTTDGPFAETKEILAGFYLVDAPDLDAAVRIAQRIPAAHQRGSVEVRPVVER
jgi:hypothetical protein